MTGKLGWAAIAGVLAILVHTLPADAPCEQQLDAELCTAARRVARHGRLLLTVGGAADADARRELMAKGEKLLQEDGVTIQAYWRSLYNHTKTNLEGGAHHIGFVVQPWKLRWV